MLSSGKRKMLTVRNNPFMASTLRTKSRSGTATMSLKTTFQLPLTSNYSLDLRHQNHNLPPLSLIFFPETFFMLQNEYGKVESTTLEPWKIKKNVPGSDSDLMKPKSQQLQSVWGFEAFQDVTVAVKRDTWSLQRYLPLTITVRMPLRHIVACNLQYCNFTACQKVNSQCTQCWQMQQLGWSSLGINRSTGDDGARRPPTNTAVAILASSKKK